MPVSYASWRNPTRIFTGTIFLFFCPDKIRLGARWGFAALDCRLAWFPQPLSMNRPTPDPSQEGNKHSSASTLFPSWEGLGVGSWSQCMRKSERRLSMNRARKREQAPRTPNADAQWPRAWDFAKRLECVRLAGAFLGSWSQCMRESERRLSMNRSAGLRPGAGERVGVQLCRGGGRRSNRALPGPNARTASVGFSRQ